MTLVSALIAVVNLLKDD